MPLRHSAPLLHCLILPGIFALATSSTLLAQTSNVASSITGVVHDASGQVIPSATIEATELDTGFTRTVQASGDGQYAVPLLPEGTYRIVVSAPSFQSYQQNGITVRVGQSSPVDVTLKAGSASETVTVTADASILNTETFDVSDGLNQKSMENMPITSRNSVRRVTRQHARERQRTILVQRGKQAVLIPHAVIQR